jgi:hypothetical protein
MYLLYAIPVVVLLTVGVFLGGGPLLLLPLLVALPLIAAYLIKVGLERRPDEVSSSPRRADEREAPSPERGGIWGERSA